MNPKTTYNNLIKKAEEFLSLAKKEYAKGKKQNKDTHIRQGAEKVWNASIQAVKALAVITGKKLPRSYKAQILFMYKYEKKHNGKLNGYPLSLAFKSFARGLHGECFYHGEYEIFELDRDFEEVEKFIDIIKKQNKKEENMQEGML